MTSKLSLAAVGAVLLLLAACGGTEAGTIALSLGRCDCQGVDAKTQKCVGVDALQGAQKIEVIVRGADLSELTASGEISAGGLDLPEIPAGKDRQVIVRATNGASSLVAVGRSALFDVKADQDQSVKVPMVALNRVHSTESVASGQCSAQQAVRAGHAAAAFKDGSALLVGGFTYDSTGGIVEYLDTVELYEPATGEFRKLDPLPSVCGEKEDETCERAFATAVVQDLPSNGGQRLLVIGGEYRDQEGKLLARGEALAFNSKTSTWTRIPMKVARRHHTATLLSNGNVFVIGGFGNPDSEGNVPVVGATEYYQANSNISTAGSATVARALHAAVAYESGVLVAGGIDETLKVALPVFQLTPTSTVQNKGSLATGVVGPSLVTHWTRLAVIGGVDPDGPERVDLTDPLSSLPDYVGPTGTGSVGQILSLDGSAVDETIELVTQRAFACTAPIDANRLLIAGGVTPAGGTPANGATAEVLVWVDQSECTPNACEQSTQCTGSTCTGGVCVASCTSDAECGKKGSCVIPTGASEGACKSDLTNSDHRCTAGAAQGCFAGSSCVVKGKFDHSFINGSNAEGSKLAKARAWGACTKLSVDQILITGGISEHYPTRDAIDVAELYEIAHSAR